ncbi:hypothetical protein EPO14_01105 [Patescibacteria group bacterium]|nr:MAG: hypothetical protein EPO14_01105 [Patescibacteria group bacterium]
MAETMYKYGKLPHYPHMMPADVAIWERFIDAFPGAYDACQYDVKVGTVPGFVEGAEHTHEQAQAPLYLRKIDVVAYKAEQIDIIELKPNASMSSIGQVNGYRILFVRDFNPPVKPKAIVITDRYDFDTAHAAAEQDVVMVQV